MNRVDEIKQLIEKFRIASRSNSPTRGTQMLRLSEKIADAVHSAAAKRGKAGKEQE